MSLAIRVEQLSKSYLRMAPGFRLRTLKSALLDRSLTEGLQADETIQALEEVSFAVERGTAFGVIGSNGSGKSTLLKILAGMLRPTSGQLEVDGRVAERRVEPGQSGGVRAQMHAATDFLSVREQIC